MSRAIALRHAVYFLLEHKSQVDHLTAFQLLRYMVRIREASLPNNLPLRPTTGRAIGSLV